MTDLITIARTITGQTDADLVRAAKNAPRLLARSTEADRIAHDRILHELAHRLQERITVDEIGCTSTECFYPLRIGLIPGVDVSIDGDIWPNSPYSHHLDRCPSRRPVPDDVAVALANAGARRVFCPRCERGHEGPCDRPPL
jgi:hypothetical protein